MNDLRIEFFEKALERVREIRQNLEGLAEDAKKAGLDDLPFDVWRRDWTAGSATFKVGFLKVSDPKRTKTARRRLLE